MRLHGSYNVSSSDFTSSFLSTCSPTESRKSDNKSGLMNDSTQDTVDHMRDMESSGRIDMGAFRGEDNHDDNEDKYGKSAKVDPDLPSDGS